MNPLTTQHIVNKSVALEPALPPDTLLAYLQDLLRWNPQLGLVSRRDPLAACERLVLESIELLTRLRDLGVHTSTRCVDVGSGGGFPGLVWALARPTWRFLLVERKVARAAFLQAEVLRLSLGHVDVFAGSAAEAVRHPEFVACDLAVAIAVGSPDAVGPEVEPLLAAKGVFAGTVAKDAAIPARVGNSLDLFHETAGDYGNYAFYRRSG